MLQQLQNNLLSQFPYLKDKKLLLASSGGRDSMVMLELFRKLSYQIAIAHCNFQLRGLESFDDQNFVYEYSEKHQIPLFSTQFDTVAFANDYKLSTQVAARELRYNWFYELLETEKYDYIITAHHADDNLETFLINLTRGTGLDGLTGIPQQNDKIIRPLLCFSGEEINDFAIENNISWREDSSNASDKYLRNKIRHHLVPVLKEMNPDFLNAFQKTQKYLQEAQDLIEDAVNMVYLQVVKEKGEEFHIDITQLLKLPNYKSYLYQWLKDFGFSAWEDIYNLPNAESGKMVYSPDFCLLKNRHSLILIRRGIIDKSEVFFIEENVKRLKFPLNLAFSEVTNITTASNSTIFVDAKKLQYPLQLRHWQEGDYFQPFGMNGKSKKLSKLFKDEKLSLIEKQNSWILCSNNQVVWVVGIRQDERFKIDSTTKNRLQITLLE